MQFTRTSVGDSVEAAAFQVPLDNFNIVLLQVALQLPVSEPDCTSLQLCTGRAPGTCGAPGQAADVPPLLWRRASWITLRAAQTAHSWTSRPATSPRTCSAASWGRWGVLEPGKAQRLLRPETRLVLKRGHTIPRRWHTSCRVAL